MRRPSQVANETSGKPRRLRRAHGGSLVELLIVVAILLVVMAIALPRLMAARKSAQEASAVVFLRNLHAAQTQYYITHGSYAATFAELEGFLASNQSGLAPLRQFTEGISPAPIATMPTLAFLLLPTPGMPDDQAFATDGPKRPTGTDQQSGGAGAPLGDSPAAGNSNPAGGSSGGSNPGAGQNSGSDSGGGADDGQGGSSSGGGGSESQGGAWSKADRMTYQGYAFYLLRPTAHNWNCLAIPVRNERNGHHYFADQSGGIRREFGRPASAQSPVL